LKIKASVFFCTFYFLSIYFCYLLLIGNVTLDNNIFLAPMAGITDIPFRLLCKEQGCGLTYTEMVSAKGIYYNDEKTKKLTAVDAAEGK